MKNTSLCFICLVWVLCISGNLIRPVKAQIPPGNLVFSDEFDGPFINTDVWGYEIGYKRNHELQYYTNRAENARIEEGNLIIEARRENYQGYAYTSASLRTDHKQTFTYGRLEMRAKIPTPLGSWPAWWAVGSNRDLVGWPKCGEIDMMEYHRGLLKANVMDSLRQWDGYKENVPLSFGDDYHIWVMEWNPNTIKLYVDGILKNTHNIGGDTVDGYNPFRQPINMLLSLAIGGNAGGNPSGTTFPLRFYVDYIRAWDMGPLSSSTPMPSSPNYTVNDLKAVLMQYLDASNIYWNNDTKTNILDAAYLIRLIGNQ